MTYKKYLLGPQMSVKNTIAYMEEKCVKAVIIVSNRNKLLGLFTLGDMRHFFLKGGQLTANITEAMNPSPITFRSITEAKKYTTKLIIYPIVDDSGIVIGVYNTDSKEVKTESLKDVPVVIMAGGKGTRLYPYTKILPKPLIPIGEYTISERIIKSFQRYGCKDYTMILNHKANMIKAYFGEIEKDYNIHFEVEDNFLGTGGGLSYLKGKIKDTFFLSNCDILIDSDLECIYQTHKMQKNIITFVCAMKDVTIPYGIIQTDADGKIASMKEKPELSFMINTGLYVIEPEVLEELKEGEFIHLPDIAKRYMEKGGNIGAFPISEKMWMDMGQFNEMEAMVRALAEDG